MVQLGTVQVQVWYSAEFAVLQCYSVVNCGAGTVGVWYKIGTVYVQ